MPFDGFPAASMKISIAEEWTVSDFGELMSQLQFLTDVQGYFGISQEYRKGADDFFKHWQGAFGSLPDDPDRDVAHERKLHQHFRIELQQFLKSGRVYSLRVKRFTFASPGSIDLVGVGRVVEQVRLFIKDILDRSDRKKGQEIKYAMAEQELLERKIKNAERLLKLGKSAGLDQERSRLLVGAILSSDEFFREKEKSGQIAAID